MSVLLLLLVIFLALYFILYRMFLRVIILGILILLFVVYKFIYLLPIISFLWLMSFILKSRLKKQNEDKYRNFEENFYHRFHRQNFNYGNNNRSENVYFSSRERKDKYYRLLGLQKDASREEIKRRYRQLAKKHHPDMANNDPQKELESKFKEINEAYQFLMKEKSKKKGL